MKEILSLTDWTILLVNDQNNTVVLVSTVCVRVHIIRKHFLLPTITHTLCINAHTAQFKDDLQFLLK